SNAVPSSLGDSREGAARFSPEAIQELLDIITPPQVHTTPPLTRVGFARQADFNTSVLNKLELAKRDPSSIDSIIELLKERNSLLALADKNPKILEAVDAARMVEGAASSSNSAMIQAVLIAQSLSSAQAAPPDRKRRATSPLPSMFQPFQGGAPAFGPGAKFIPRPQSLFGGYAGYAHQRSTEVHKQFVVEEVGRLLKSGAIELCTRPAVISPLSVAEGKKLRLIHDLSELNLGYCIDLKCGTVSVSGDRVASALERLAHLREVESPTVRDRNCAIGSLMSMTLILGDTATLLSRNLLSTVGKAQQIGLPSSTPVPLSQAEKGKISQWISELKDRSVRSFVELPWHFDLKVETDASASGLGVVIKELDVVVNRASRNLTHSEREESSTMRELRAVDFAIHTFEREWNGKNILFLGDNQSAISILRKGSMKPELNEVASRIERARAHMNANFKFFWLPREMNEEADAASRDIDRDDWSVQNWVFEKAVEKWGRPGIDMFADESNAKCETFVSRSPSRGAAAIDAFSSPHLWRSTLLWCVPPPYLLCQTLAWLRGNRAKAILGLPYWTSHPIFPSLFPPNYTPPFVKDYLMFAEGMHVINPGTITHGPFSRPFMDSPFTLLLIDFNFI
ncbi:hypothetical protein PMAYCL1PPCAC_02000, partial [Pristionchus mayeri]